METYAYGDIVQRKSAAMLTGLKGKAVNQYAVPVKFAAVKTDFHLTFKDAASVSETVVQAETDLTLSHDAYADLRLLLCNLAVDVKYLTLSK